MFVCVSLRFGYSLCKKHPHYSICDSRRERRTGERQKKEETREGKMTEWQKTRVFVPNYSCVRGMCVSCHYQFPHWGMCILCVTSNICQCNISCVQYACIHLKTTLNAWYCGPIGAHKYSSKILFVLCIHLSIYINFCHLYVCVSFVVKHKQTWNMLYFPTRVKRKCLGKKCTHCYWFYKVALSSLMFYSFNVSVVYFVLWSIL